MFREMDLHLQTPTTSSSSEGKVTGSAPSLYFPTLDGLRFCAFLLVFIHHLPRSSMPILGFLHDQGWVGVHIFLALSAYLLTAILGLEYATKGSISLFRFYVRRALRIWPLYYAFCLIAFVTSIFIIESPWSVKHIARFSGLLTFTDNILCGINGYNFLPFSPHLWTISLEEQFYLVLPFLLRGWLRDRRALVTGLLLVWVGFLAVRLLCVVFHAPHPLLWTSVFSADSLLIGTALGAINWRPTWTTPTRILFIIGGLMGIFSGGFTPSLDLVGMHQVFIYSSVGIGTALILLAALHEPLLAFLGAKPLRYLGKISYGLYVFHFFGIFIGRKLLSRAGTDNWWLLAFASLVATVGLSVLSYEIFEKKFLQLKRRFETFHTRPV